jgi:hypothetical protein
MNLALGIQMAGEFPRGSSPQLYKVLQKELCNGIPNVAVWQVLRKRLYWKAYKLSIVQGVQGVKRWIVCTHLGINVFVTRPQ